MLERYLYEGKIYKSEYDVNELIFNGIATNVHDIETVENKVPYLWGDNVETINKNTLLDYWQKRNDLTYEDIRELEFSNDEKFLGKLLTLYARENNYELV